MLYYFHITFISISLTKLVLHQVKKFNYTNIQDYDHYSNQVNQRVCSIICKQQYSKVGCAQYIQTLCGYLKNNMA